ncbi:hypothetical protein COW36_16165 [bacterium (Candidatus Blackallbacteria) CG17_big_fil_post_rev_8_21_14_2_50_48_46]|uniref:Uncharacterized protein n=1 Tax=bacterium (Candidatus Blackallbacteria) CG17_big_fil_post_rev_8_21_14_2_50_48_46 TaxID=2014261 RepID=A0A2M7G1S6_9BACT|nr:MAG: hypothetical protein COW64_05195 [bacterium (Candidatus Blackallbacteria) CG18_big_fil_WC_8_21_14_2_50_49_26]PIW15672.1 MAG: hypothetical protein COW36_16165 [bacterium (Candidatus Blackallbacteria) CG17_big_fil_post_rev_8_21_14_2_50_48_46]
MKTKFVFASLLALGLAAPAYAQTLNTADIFDPLNALQNSVEIYGVDHEGQYPPNLGALYQNAVQSSQPYWLDRAQVNGVKAPWLKKSLPVVFADSTLFWGSPLSGSIVFHMVPGKNQAGYVLYTLKSPGCYVLHRLQSSGKPFVHKGKPVVVNSCQ